MPHQLLAVPGNLLVRWRDRPARRAERAIADLRLALQLLGVAVPTDHIADHLRARYRRTPTRYLPAAGWIGTFAAMTITQRLKLAWVDGSVLATDSEIVLSILCFVPVFIGELWPNDRRREGLIRDLLRAVGACSKAKVVPAAERSQPMRVLARRCQSVRFSLPNLRSKFTSARELQRHVWQARVGLYATQRQLDVNPDQALRDLAVQLTTIADRCAAGPTLPLLDPIVDQAGQDARPPRNYDWVRRIGVVLFSAGGVWWASNLPLEGAAQVFVIGLVPFLAFVLFYGVNHGLDLLSRWTGGGQPQDAPTVLEPGEVPDLGNRPQQTPTVESRTPSARP
ncbi:hypothetical protein ACWCYY_11440 [Kitasatospora sp. NPDC001664]